MRHALSPQPNERRKCVSSSRGSATLTVILPQMARRVKALTWICKRNVIMSYCCKVEMSGSGAFAVAVTFLSLRLCPDTQGIPFAYSPLHEDAQRPPEGPRKRSLRRVRGRCRVLSGEGQCKRSLRRMRDRCLSRLPPGGGRASGSALSSRFQVLSVQCDSPSSLSARKVLRTCAANRDCRDSGLSEKHSAVVWE